MSEVTNENLSSVKVNKTSTGKYSFEVKVYYKYDYGNAIEEVEKIHKELGEKFKKNGTKM